ncbi:TonB-dependent receptor [bacterium]|nr:TonB-dependent receptor [bacterium]
MKPVSKITLLFIVILFNISFAQSDNGRLKGIIVDSDGKPVAGLHILLENTHYGSITDARGHFLLPHIPAGIYTVILHHIAFKAQRLQRIIIIAGQIENLGKIAMTQHILKAPDIMITAARRDKTSLEIPAPINLLPAFTIRERQAKALPEALREETGIAVQKTSHGGGSAIIRGLSSNQILLLIDGIRLNNSTYRRGNHPYLGSVDYQMVQHLEVVRGPMSVLYGSDALGGTINAISDLDNYSTDNSFQYKLYSRIATVDKERSGRAEFRWTSAKVAVEGGLSLKKFGHLKRGSKGGNAFLNKSPDVIQNPTAFKAGDANIKILFRPNQKRSIIAAYQISRRPEVPRYDKYENSNYFKWLYRNQDRNLAYIKYKENFDKEWMSNLQTTISFQRQSEGRLTQKTAQSIISNEYDNVDTWGFTLQAQAFKGRHQLIYGIEHYRDLIHSTAEQGHDKAFTPALRGRYPNLARYNSVGAYIQDELSLTSRFTAVGGIRYSHFNTNFNLPLDETGSLWEEIDQSFQALTGSLAFSFRLAGNTFIHANMGQAFRAPNLSDLSKLGESKGNIWEVPNSKLKPETMNSFDLGLKWRKEKLKGSVSAYYSRIHHILENANASYLGDSTFNHNGIDYQIKSKQNTGNASIYGIEAELELILSQRLRMYGNASTTRGQNLTTNQPLSKIPPVLGMAALRWQNNRHMIETYIRFAGKQNRLSEDDLDDDRICPYGTPGWYTLNLRTRIQLPHSVQILAAIENILDLNYREHASGINAPGRNLILSIEYSQ